MTKSIVATLKIRPSIFELILSGIKQYEIRDSSLEDVNIICYLDSDTGEFLGSYAVGAVNRVDRSTDKATIDCSGVDAATFYDLFPSVSSGGPETLWIAQLQKPIDVCDALGIGVNHVSK